MKKTLIVLILISLFLSCQKKEDNFTKEMITKLDVVDNGLPSRYSFLNLYILTDNNEILETDNNYLFLSYTRYYQKKFKNFEGFLDEVLNKKFVFDQSSLNKIIHLESFKLNKKIEKEYSEIGFNEFLKKYSKKTNRTSTKLQLNKSIIKEHQYQTIVYILYKNKYDIARDCYIGIDYIIKREDSFK